ncbi:MAG: threonine--tRNA ligase [Candidatus Kerfeldbacteria bacterium]|nr:threonine--tRNA ligase [Candidatus Kerfeldbacteria bacterium]
MENAQHVENIRHTCAHVLARSMLKLFPGTKLAIGPAIEHGFYQDFEPPRPITDKDLAAIEKEMRKFLAHGHGMTGEKVSVKEARESQKPHPYKLEIIDELEQEGKDITLYTMGDFVDLCRGGHVENTKEINPKAVKLTKVAGAYWRGDEKKPMLTRIYGLAFETPEELKAHMTMLAEAEKRDHRKIGKELDLFVFSELVGSGLPLFTPRGTVILSEFTKLIYELQEPHGYLRVDIPHLAKPELYKRSGHWDKFKDDIFHVRGKHDSEFVLKPMNCPHHAQIYASRPRSYRDLPLRYAEITKMYRDENPGQLQGLSRVRSITIDDAHVFCRPDQIHNEVMNMIDIAEAVYKLYNIKLTPILSVRDPKTPEKYLGTDEGWASAEATLKKVLKDRGIKTFDLDTGGAAFYGPKIDLSGIDAIGRKWQLATFQIDFNQPEGLDLTYVDERGKEVRPVMIHRALLGSMERHLMVLLEHFAGAFPVWLSPVQIALLPLSEKHIDFARTLSQEFKSHGVRVDVDENNETVGNKIRKAVKQKVPYLIVLGDKEVKSGSLPIRSRGSKESHEMVKNDFIKKVLEEIKERK